MLLCCIACSAQVHADSAYSILSKVVIVANENDPLSIKVAEYYLKKRNISSDRLAYVNFDPHEESVQPRQFIGVKTILEYSIPEDTQFYILAWAKPYRVGCMSITSAFALGFDEAYCSQKICGPTVSSPYYDSDTSKPYSDFGVRPTMMLAYKNYADVKKLIDRGIAADGTNPRGTAYLVSTNDKARNIRANTYDKINKKQHSKINIEIIEANSINNKNDVMFYFTGLKKVPNIETNTYLPGSIADHLTSSAGNLFGTNQMSILEWLDAGATASYGTVIEPCNYPQKFPNPEIVMRRYLSGETVIESYWKSVAWPGEGLFIGEPLARPFFQGEGQ